MTKVENNHGTEIYFDQAVVYMDDTLREEIHRDLAPCTEQEFFAAYAKAHYERFGEVWICDEPNPVL